MSVVANALKLKLKAALVTKPLYKMNHTLSLGANSLTRNTRRSLLGRFHSFDLDFLIYHSSVHFGRFACCTFIAVLGRATCVFGEDASLHPKCRNLIVR